MFINQKKKIRYVWLNTRKATRTTRNPSNNFRFKFEWDLSRDIDVSKNAVMSVVGFHNKETVQTDSAIILRCPNIPQFDVLENNPPIIHLAKSVQSGIGQQIDFETIKYKIGDPSNFRTIEIIAGGLKNKERGISDLQQFILGLKFEDEEDENVNANIRPIVNNSSYHVPNTT
jgi:hypothetical protein